MDNDYGITKDTTLQEISKIGGKVRAKKLSPERRKEIATLASHSRKCMSGIPRATHSGELIIGNQKILCSVLDNGKRVITETGLYELMNLTRGGRRGQDKDFLPRFLCVLNLKPFMPIELDSGPISFEFISVNNIKAYGYEATIISDICKIYLDARRNNVLNEAQKQTAFQCEIILQALSKVGIVALIDSCTGYEKQRENNELERLFSKFIAKELQPWVKRFPSEFFSHLKRFYGIEEMKKNPLFFGHLINRWIYKELSPEIHEELKRLNPVLNSGNRKHAHHQLLTQDIGCPALTKQIQKVTTLLSVSDSKEQFEKLLEKSR